MYLVQPTYLKIACDHPTYTYLITIGSSRVGQANKDLRLFSKVLGTLEV